MSENIIYRTDRNIYTNRRLVLEAFIDRKIARNDGILQLLDLEIFDNNPVAFKRKLESGNSKSEVDKNIELNCFQLECLKLLESNDLMISAPTSFGKTFISLEYIKRNRESLKNIAYIVPTIALMNELFKKISEVFGNEYSIILNDFEINESDQSLKNIFILVPERALGEKMSYFLENTVLDLCVYDEIYKLSRIRKKERSDDRLIVMNYVYSQMLDKARKILLLGPFIKKIKFLDNKRKITQYITDYTPVINSININPNYKWWKVNSGEKKLVYYESPRNIQKALIDLDFDNSIESNETKEVIKWIEENIYENWYYIKCLKNGIGVHHGRTPIYLRSYIENSYKNSLDINTIICTSTLMEGINTPTNKLVIVDIPSTVFELNNLIGRVGRLNINNPIKGEVITLGEIDKGDIYDSDKWEEITLLYDDEGDIIDNDEYLYLEKKDDTQKYIEYKNFIDTLYNDFDLSVADIKKSGVKYDVLHKFVKMEIINELESCFDSDQYSNFEILKILLKCIPLGYINTFFEKKNYKSIEIKYNDRGEEVRMLPIYYPMYKLIEDNNVKQIIDYFIKEYEASIEDTNLYVDSIFELEKFIRFKFSQVIPLLNLFIDWFSPSQKNKLIGFIDFILRYIGKDDRLRKMLLDFGIPSTDCNAVEVMISHIGLDDNPKASAVYKALKEIKGNRRLDELSPFTQKIVNDM